ncbi:uncharacterized protein [Sylvia atricapilla]|uniref:uncharacterized protein n=1 Tax=Sylvia atricapilla TaxID=48155 RepID=UPI0033932598
MGICWAGRSLPWVSLAPPPARPAARADLSAHATASPPSLPGAIARAPRSSVAGERSVPGGVARLQGAGPARSLRRYREVSPPPPAPARLCSGEERRRILARSENPPPPTTTQPAPRCPFVRRPRETAPRARAAGDASRRRRALGHVGGRRRHLVAPPSAGSGAARNGGAAGRRGCCPQSPPASLPRLSLEQQKPAALQGLDHPLRLLPSGTWLEAAYPSTLWPKEETMKTKEERDLSQQEERKEAHQIDINQSPALQLHCFPFLGNGPPSKDATASTSSGAAPESFILLSPACGKTGVLHKKSWGGKINICYLRLCLKPPHCHE